MDNLLQLEQRIGGFGKRRNIEENGNIEKEISEDNEHRLQAFTIKANRKRVRRLKEVALYNVAPYLSCDGII